MTKKPVHRPSPRAPDHTNGQVKRGAAHSTAHHWQNAFEQELSPEAMTRILDERARALAEIPPAAANGDVIDLLVFRLGGEKYGVAVTHVQEIYPLEQLARVPRTPDFVVGVFSARGRILSVIDLRAFLGLSRVGLSDQTKIIVVSGGHTRDDGAHIELGILADEVADVVAILTDAIEPPLATHTGAHTEYFHGVTADLLLVLNLDALLADKRLIIQEEIM